MENHDVFSRVNRLIGDESAENIQRKRIILFGVGGVGSWCAECLVRTGVMDITIVDTDIVSVSNINRQLMATTKTVGQVKVDALKTRLLDINPNARINAVQKLFTQENAKCFNLDSYDYIIDAIDSLKDKAVLILEACKTGAVFFSSMGAALKIDPTRIRVAEFWKVTGDPLARALRRKFKSQNIFPKRKFLCVFSDELLQNKGETNENPDDNKLIQKAQINGSLAHITAIFGCSLAGMVIKHINDSSLPSSR